MRGSRGGGGGGRGSGPPLKNHKNIGFLSNTGSIPWNSQSYEAIIQWWAIIGKPAKRHLNGNSLAGRWWPAFSGIWILSPSLKNIVRVAELDRTPSDKTFWIRTWKESIYRNPMQHRQALTRGYIMLNTFLERVRVCRPGLLNKCAYSYALNVLLNVFFLIKGTELWGIEFMCRLNAKFALGKNVPDSFTNLFWLYFRRTLRSVSFYTPVSRDSYAFSWLVVKV